MRITKRGASNSTLGLLATVGNSNYRRNFRGDPAHDRWVYTRPHYDRGHRVFRGGLVPGEPGDEVAGQRLSGMGGTAGVALLGMLLFGRAIEENHFSDSCCDQSS